MNENRERRRWGWPLAFFILNFAAIVAWFIFYSDFMHRELAVTAMTPSGVEVNPERVTEIRLGFNFPLDPASVNPDSLRLVPPVAGKAELADNDNAIIFRPREPLRAATLYTLLLSPGIRGARGEPPPKQLLEFSTTRFKLEGASQVSFDRNSYTVELVFNQPIDASELGKALAVKSSLPASDSNPASRVTVVGNATANRQRLRIQETGSAFFLVTLPAGLTGAAGPLGLDREEKLLWRIAGRDTIDEAKRPDWAKDLAATVLKPEVALLGMVAGWDEGSGEVRVHTTAQLDVTEARNFIKIAPEIPFTVAPTWNGIKILGGFQPGKQYRITLAAGMPAGYAGNLAKEESRQVWFDDLPESLSFTHGGGFLSPEGLLKVSVKSRNVAEFNLGARRLYASNIVEALLRDYTGEVEEDFSEPEITKKLKTGGVRNQEKETLLDLRELLGAKPLGVYGLEIWRNDHRWYSRNALVSVSDLGLVARLGRDSLVAWTTSIRDGEPRAQIKVSVYSNKRQLLSEDVTGEDGVVSLTIPSLPEGEKPALVLAEAGGEEFSFVRLDRDLRSRPSEARRGEAYAAGYEVFLTADRGVYRGGEKVLLAGLVRDADVAIVPNLPLEISLLSPEQRELRKSTVRADAAGRIALETPLGESYSGGLYTVEARLPGQKETLGSAMFRIADYLPETLSVAMEFSEEKEKKREADREGAADPDNRLLIRVSRLAGGDLGPMPAKVMAFYTPAPFAPKNWEDWTFGDTRVNARQSERRERDVALTLGKGEAVWDNPALDFPAAAKMSVRVEAAEPGGRPVSATLDTIIHQAPYYIGIKAEPRAARSNEKFPLSLAAVRPDGEVYDEDGEWTGELFRVEYNGVMKRNADGRLVYEWARREIPEAELAGAWHNGKSEADPVPLAGGQYRLVIDSPEGKGCVLDFSVQGAGAAWYGEDPETLTLTLDRDAYKIGDTAVASTSAPFAGKALITVETDEVLAHWLKDFQEGDNSFEIPIVEKMRPNAYVAVTLLRPTKAEAEWKPHRLSGTALLKVDNRDRRLKLELAAPDSFAPGAKAAIAITATRDGKTVADAPVVVWGVDVGVLSLTGYKTPSPWDRFYQTRRIGVSEADMFSRLSPELTEWLAGREASPGGSGGEDGEFARRLNPIFASRVKAAVVFDARLTTDADGVAKTELSIPEFAGRLRLMCWASSGNDMGSAEKEIEVKAPVSVSAAWPRFAAPGDEFEIPVRVLNRSGKQGVATVTCEANDVLKLEPATQEVELADNQAKVVVVKATAGSAGLAKAAVTASMDGSEFADRVELSVRPSVLFARESGSIVLKPGEKQSLIIGASLLANGSRGKLVAGGSPLISLTGSMEYLLDYPYGCAEQTASRLLALVFLPDLLALSRPGQLESGEISRLATACVERLQLMQNSNGSLRMWPSGGEELFWVSAQALFALAESKSAGHAIPPQLIENLASYLSDRLDGRLNDTALDADDGEAAAQASLALAKVGKLKRSWLLRFEEVAEARAKKGTPLCSAALAFFCESVAAAGDREAATKLFQRFGPSGVQTGVSRNRVVELAAWLMASMAVGASEEQQALLAMELGDTLKQGYTYWSTRENSLVLAALGRYWQKAGRVPDATASVAIDGKISKFSTRMGGAWDKLAAGTKVEVDNPGVGALRMFWLAEGVPLSGKAREEDKGLVARRKIYDLKGKELAEPFTLRQGDVYEVRLYVSGKADDLVLADLLPAGLEIEDASLKGRAVDGESSKGLAIRHVEVKDDRLLVFASVGESGEYRYLVRAVTGGRFAWPALDAGRMYDATARSVHGRSELKVSGGKEAANDR